MLWHGGLKLTALKLAMAVLITFVTCCLARIVPRLAVQLMMTVALANPSCCVHVFCHGEVITAMVS